MEPNSAYNKLLSQLGDVQMALLEMRYNLRSMVERNQVLESRRDELLNENASLKVKISTHETRWAIIVNLMLGRCVIQC